MRIAVLGWGSLIWDPRELSVKPGDWHEDGPTLPIEFARISLDGRLTLVTHSGAPLQTVLWKESALECLEAARTNLKDREKCSLESVHALDHTGELYGTCEDDETVEAVRDWLRVHPEFGAAVWTGLHSNWREKRGRDFSVDDGLAYLTSLRDQWQLAAEYIDKAPTQMRTGLRAGFEAVRSESKGC